MCLKRSAEMTKTTELVINRPTLGALRFMQLLTPTNWSQIEW